MRALLAILAGSIAIAATSGCAGQDEERTPAACRDGAPAFKRALARAPDPVRLDGTPLSKCFVQTTNAGELYDVGTALVNVAAELRESSRQDPRGPALVRLGYLDGAMERAEAGTQNVTYELQRRLEQELGGLEGESAAFERGRRAGLRTG